MHRTCTAHAPHMHRTCTAHAPHMHVHSSLPVASPMHVHVHVPRTPCTHHTDAMDIPRPTSHRCQVYALLAELGMHCDVTLAAKQLRCRPVYATPLPKPTSRELRDGTLCHTTGLEPRTSRQGPRQVCYSHVRASPRADDAWQGTWRTGGGPAPPPPPLPVTVFQVRVACRFGRGRCAAL